MTNAIIINDTTAYRAAIISNRTNSDPMGVMKAMLMIP